jgi:hypothetical protein
MLDPERDALFGEDAAKKHQGGLEGLHALQGESQVAACPPGDLEGHLALRRGAMDGDGHGVEVEEDAVIDLASFSGITRGTRVNEGAFGGELDRESTMP